MEKTSQAPLLSFDREGKNTRVRYEMQLDGKKLKSGEFTFEGRIDAEDAKVMTESLTRSGGAIDPLKYGLPDLGEAMPLHWRATGDEVHVITSIEHTDAKPSHGAEIADSFACSFLDVDLAAANSLAP